MSYNYQPRTLVTSESSINLTEQDTEVICTYTDDVSVFFPAASYIGQSYTVKNETTGTGMENFLVSIQSIVGGVLIDDLAYYLLADYHEAVKFVWDGTGWVSATRTNNRFLYLKDAITNTFRSQIFTVGRFDASTKERGVVADYTGGAGFAALRKYQPCTDGKYVYTFSEVAANTWAISVRQPYALTEIRSIGTPRANDTIDCICCDGQYVYMASSSGGGDYDLYSFNPETGAQVNTISLTDKAMNMASNGYRLALTYDVDTNLEIYTTALVGPVQYDHTAVLVDVCIDSTQVYAIGVVGAGGHNVIRVDFAGNLLGGLPTTNVPYSIACDGNYVYISGNVLSGAETVWKYDRFLTSKVWSQAIGTVRDLIVDDHLLILNSGATRLLKLYDKLNGVPIAVANVAGVSTVGYYGICTDGIEIYADREDAGTPYVSKVFLGYNLKHFQRVGGNDPHRRPYYTLATPVEPW
jgi:hypothetical protein